jgi:hypothetical protein
MSTLEVAEDRRVALPRRDRLLVDPELARHDIRTPGQATGHRTGLNRVGFVPGDPQDLGSAREAGLEQDVDREPLEQRGEPAAWFGPGNAYLAHAVLGTAHPRYPRMEVRPEPAAVQVTPGAFGVVVMQIAPTSAWSPAT